MLAAKRATSLLKLVVIRQEGISAFSSRRSLNKPEKPKAPSSSFIFYVCDHFSKYRKEGNKTTDVVKNLSLQFKALPVDQKQIYVDASKKDQERYRMEMNRLTEVDLEKIRKFKRQKKTETQMKKFPMLIDLHECPKRPLCPYVMFTKSFPNKRETGESMRSYIQRVSVAWRALDQSRKSELSEQYRIDMLAYNNRMLEWKSEMIRSGKEELMLTMISKADNKINALKAAKKKEKAETAALRKKEKLAELKVKERERLILAKQRQKQRLAEDKQKQKQKNAKAVEKEKNHRMLVLAKQKVAKAKLKLSVAKQKAKEKLVKSKAKLREKLVREKQKQEKEKQKLAAAKQKKREKLIAMMERHKRKKMEASNSKLRPATPSLKTKVSIPKRDNTGGETFS